MRNGLGEKALRGRENNSAILHCAEQPARFFLLAEYDTRVALKMLSEIATRQQPIGCMSVPQKGALAKIAPRTCPFPGAGQFLASIWSRTQMRGFEKLLRIHMAVNHIKRRRQSLNRRMPLPAAVLAMRAARRVLRLPAKWTYSIRPDRRGLGCSTSNAATAPT